MKNTTIIIIILLILSNSTLLATENYSKIKTISIAEDKSNVKLFCPNNMIYVHGMMVEGDSEYIEALQNNTCKNWISKKFPERCKEFDSNSWNQVTQKLPKKEMKFCIDTYEFPNIKDTKPLINIDWIEANQKCLEQDKRLCTEEEWSFACEGEEAMPYPYGYIRDDKKCNIDRAYIAPDFDKINQPEEINRLWQGKNSGEMADCVSPFQVHDMTGNVDEFTTSVRKTGYKSILKGGYWSVVRNRCRASTRSHNQWHHAYQQGFRCCKSPIE